jgi:hypothetical protein
MLERVGNRKVNLFLINTLTGASSFLSSNVVNSLGCIEKEPGSQILKLSVQ